MKEQTTRLNDMTEGALLRSLLRFALPLMAANGLQTAYNMVDSVIVGRAISASALAAVTTCGDVMTLYTLISMGFGAAGQIIIAQFVGKKDRAAIPGAIGALLLIQGVLALVLGGVCVGFARWHLRVLNLPEESVRYGMRYLTACGGGMLFIYGYNAVSSVLRGLGDSRGPLLFVAVASAVNVALDLLFVVVFRWDTLGAALATVAGQLVSFVTAVLYLLRRRESLGLALRLRKMKPDRRDIRLLLKVGVPHSMQNAAILLSILFVISCVNRYGVAAATVNGVAMKLENICRIITDSMGTASSTMIAQCFGAGKLDRCRRTTRATFVVCFGYCAVCALVIGLFPRQVFSVFVTDAAVLNYAAAYAAVGVGCALGLALRATFCSVVTGVGNAALSMTIGIADGVVARIGLSLLLSASMGLLGFWWGSCLAGYVSALLGALYYFSGRWKHYRLIP